MISLVTLLFNATLTYYAGINNLHRGHKEEKGHARNCTKASKSLQPFSLLTRPCLIFRSRSVITGIASSDITTHPMQESRDAQGSWPHLHTAAKAHQSKFPRVKKNGCFNSYHPTTYFKMQSHCENWWNAKKLDMLFTSTHPLSINHHALRTKSFFSPVNRSATDCQSPCSGYIWCQYADHNRSLFNLESLQLWHCACSVPKKMLKIEMSSTEQNYTICPNHCRQNESRRNMAISGALHFWEHTCDLIALH